MNSRSTCNASKRGLNWASIIHYVSLCQQPWFNQCFDKGSNVSPTQMEQSAKVLADWHQMFPTCFAIIGTLILAAAASSTRPNRLIMWYLILLIWLRLMFMFVYEMDSLSQQKFLPNLTVWPLVINIRSLTPVSLTEECLTLKWQEEQISGRLLSIAKGLGMAILVQEFGPDWNI